MSDLDRLHEIMDALPPEQVHALLTLLETPQAIGDEEFALRLAEVPEEEVDDETVTRILAAEAEQGESISRGEMKQISMRSSTYYWSGATSGSSFRERSMKASPNGRRRPFARGVL